MKSDEDYFSRNMTYFNVFLRILRLGGKYAYFTVFYNGFERTEQLWLPLNLPGQLWPINLMADAYVNVRRLRV